MLINHRVWMIVILGLLFLLSFIAVYNYGVDKGKEGIKKYIEISNNYKIATGRFMGLYLQQKNECLQWKNSCHSLTETEIIELKIH